MAIYSILPSTNLRYQDIRDTLNANGGTVGNTSADANSIWSEAAKINMWAIHKPIYIQGLSKNTDYNGYSVAGSDPLIGSMLVGNGNTLFASVPSVVINNKITDISADTNGFLYKLGKDLINSWVYKRPTGGTFPYRLFDFGGYNPAAINPMPKITTLSYGFEPSTGAVNINFSIPDAGSNINNWSLDNLLVPPSLSLSTPKFSSLYKAILFFNDSLSDVFWLTEDTVGDRNFSLANNNNVTISNKIGKWNARLFFSNVPLALNSLTYDSPSYFIPSDGTKYSIILYDINNPVVVKITTHKYLDSNNIQLNVIAKVTSYSSFASLTNIKIYGTADEIPNPAYDELISFPNQTADVGHTVSFQYLGDYLGGVKTKFEVTVNGTAYSVVENIDRF